MIRVSHEKRQYKPGPFPALWEKTRTRLLKYGNATDYANWKTSEVLRNHEAFQKLDDEIAEAWSGVQLIRTKKTKKSVHYRRVSYEKLQHLQIQRDTLKPDATLDIDDALEIAIAYWIEARNAFNEGDENRAMHALIQCSFYLGTTYSPVTEAEAQRARRLLGVDDSPKDDIAYAAVEVMLNYKIKRRITHEDFLTGEIADTIEKDPKYANVVKAFARWNNNDPEAEKNVGERIHRMLVQWTDKKSPPHSSSIKKHFQELLEQAMKPRSRSK